MPQSVLKVHPADNVLVALRTLEAGEQVQYEDALYTLESRVEAKHKFATEPLSPGDIVRMYGVRVGRAVSPIARGGLISTLNVRHDAEPYQLGERRTSWAKPDVSRWESATFDGYHRSDGQVGTANYWLMVPLVFCENRNIKVLREALLEPLGYATERSFRPDISELIRLHQAGAPAEQILTTPLHSHAETARARRVFPNVDGIRFLLHEGGCGGTRQDSDALLRLLAGYVAHPNVAGATILSLGCQHAQVKLFE
ncbi:MAG: altronate dehydratase, partial [Bacteroidetes bacterium]